LALLAPLALLALPDFLDPLGLKVRKGFQGPLAPLALPAS
jgi:hypothetical protein